jgi:hypothetical protein
MAAGWQMVPARGRRVTVTGIFGIMMDDSDNSDHIRVTVTAAAARRRSWNPA